MNRNRLIIFIITAVLLPSCGQKRAERLYTEIVTPQPEAPFVHPPMRSSHSDSMNFASEDRSTQEMLKGSVSNIPLEWATPKAWSEEPGNGMRLATFRNANMECSLVSMAGGSGGVEANVVRWARQLGIERLSPSQIQKFITESKSGKTSGGFVFTILNFAQLQPQESAGADSMVAAIIDADGTSVFAKITGTKAALAGESDAFTQFVKSLKLRHE